MSMPVPVPMVMMVAMVIMVVLFAGFLGRLGADIVDLHGFVYSSDG
jgi:hypothetical protein